MNKITVDSNDYSIVIEGTEVKVDVERMEYEVSLSRTGPQGARGPRGDKGDSGSSFLTYDSAGATSGHMLVTTNDDGEVIYIDNKNPLHLNRLIGISTNAATIGMSVNIQSGGYLEHGGWTFTPDEPLFVGENGAIIQTLNGDAVFQQIFGYALTPTQILIRIQPAITIA
jgi:hypothetical protein